MITLNSTKVSTVSDAVLNDCLVLQSVADSVCTNTVSKVFTDCAETNTVILIDTWLDAQEKINATGQTALQGLASGGGNLIEWSYATQSQAQTAQASITLPGITASANLDHTLPSYVASASVTLPAIMAQGNINLGSPDYNAQASITLPGITASANLDHTLPSYVASASITLPAIIAQGNINFGLPDYNAQASIILPGISTSIAVDHTIPGYSASATITTPGITAYIDKSPPAIVFGSIIVLSETLTQPTNYHIH